jgi:lysosome membrane protein 2
LVYNKSETVIDDIDVYTYAPEANLFAFHTDNPDNEGFCVPAGHCLPAGILNLTTCQAGVPIIMSSPHFLYADERFLKDVDGLSPDPLLHNTFLSVEPTTSLLMKANKRLQFNLPLFEDKRIM